MIGSIKVGLAAWAIAGPLLAGGGTYLTMRAHERIVVDGAVKRERSVQVGICSRQMAEQITLLNANANEGIGEARTAADEVAKTPDVPAEIAALCKISSSCRERAP